MNLLIFTAYRSIARREVNRINADMENARRQAQSIDSKLQEYERELLGLQHKLDFQVGLNMQLEEMNEQLERHIKECKVKKKPPYSC